MDQIYEPSKHEYVNTAP